MRREMTLSVLYMYFQSDFSIYNTCFKVAEIMVYKFLIHNTIFSEILE